MMKLTKYMMCGVVALVTVGVDVGIATADVFVKGHYRNGKFVKPHWRSSPDRSRANNWSIRGNVNPYTGKAGTQSLTSSGRRVVSNQARVASNETGAGGGNLYYGGVAGDEAFGVPFECEPGTYLHLQSCLPMNVEHAGYVPLPKEVQIRGGVFTDYGLVR